MSSSPLPQRAQGFASRLRPTRWILPGVALILGFAFALNATLTRGKGA